MGRLQELVRERLGVPTTWYVNRLRATAPYVTGQIALQSPDRVVLSVINTSTVNVYLGPKFTQSPNEMIRLNPNGGSLTLTWDEDFDLTGVAWYGAADVNASPIMVLELIAT